MPRPTSDMGAFSDEALTDAIRDAILAAADARRRRRGAFTPERMSEPAWAMLIELFARELERERSTVTGLAIAAGVSVTSGLRAIAGLIEAELVARVPDREDGRRTHLVPTDLYRRLVVEHWTGTADRRAETLSGRGRNRKGARRSHPPSAADRSG